MDTRQLTLKQQLDAYRIDEPDALEGFTARLARENGWTRQYTARVIDEYKRFALMAVTVEHPVTPRGIAVAHHAETDLGDLQPGPAKSHLLHV